MLGLPPRPAVKIARTGQRDPNRLRRSASDHDESGGGRGSILMTDHPRRT